MSDLGYCGVCHTPIKHDALRGTICACAHVVEQKKEELRKLPDLVVTRNGVPVEDQKAGLREFMERCERKPERRYNYNHAQLKGILMLAYGPVVDERIARYLADKVVRLIDEDPSVQLLLSSLES